MSQGKMIFRPFDGRTMTLAELRLEYLKAKPVQTFVQGEKVIHGGHEWKVLSVDSIQLLNLSRDGMEITVVSTDVAKAVSNLN